MRSVGGYLCIGVLAAVGPTAHSVVIDTYSTSLTARVLTPGGPAMGRMRLAA
jgi:hypothetical protein